MDRTAFGLPLEHRAISANGIELHTVLAGPADGAPVLLLHGFPEFWYGWRHQIDPLADAGLRVIVPDLRGYNLSSRPRGAEQYAIEVLERDLLALMDALELDQAGVVGHDWGGLLTWWLAMHHPERLRRAVILNAPHPEVFQSTVRGNPLQLFRSGYLLFFQMPLLPEALLAAGNFFWLEQALVRTSRPGTFSPAELEHYREAWAQPGALGAMLDWYRGLPRSRPSPQTSAITVPMLLIWGERDVALSLSMAEPSIARCAHGQLRRLPQAGHWVQHEEHAEVNRLLIEHLAEEQPSSLAL